LTLSGGAFGPIVDTPLLVEPEAAMRQRAADQQAAEQQAREAVVAAESSATRPAVTVPVRDEDTASAVSAHAALAVPAPPVPPRPEHVRFFGAVELNPERYNRDWNRVSEEALQHLTAAEGSKVQIRGEITPQQPDGCPADRRRIVPDHALTPKSPRPT